MTQNSDTLRKHDTTNANILNKKLHKNNNLQNEKSQVSIYKVYYESIMVIVATKQNIEKYLNNIKTRNNNKCSLLLDIVNSPYKTYFIENFSYHTKEEKTNRLLQIESKEKDLKYGLTNEINVLYIIQRYFFNDEILPTANEKYCKYDYIGLKSQILYELKSNTYTYQKYKTAVIGVEKFIENHKQIFLFSYETNTDLKELYYFIVPRDFNTRYKQRQIYLKERNKYNWIYDIPREELILIKSNENIKLNLEITEHIYLETIYNVCKVRTELL
jgi:hypothetical protein